MEKTSPSAFCPLTLNSPRTLKSKVQSSFERMRMPVISSAANSGKSACSFFSASALVLSCVSGVETGCAALLAVGSSMKPSRQAAASEKILLAMPRAPFLTLCIGYYSARM